MSIKFRNIPFVGYMNQSPTLSLYNSKKHWRMRILWNMYNGMPFSGTVVSTYYVIKQEGYKYKSYLVSIKGLILLILWLDRYLLILYSQMPFLDGGSGVTVGVPGRNFWCISYTGDVFPSCCSRIDLASWHSSGYGGTRVLPYFSWKATASFALLHF